MAPARVSAAAGVLCVLACATSVLSTSSGLDTDGHWTCNALHPVLGCDWDRFLDASDGVSVTNPDGKLHLSCLDKNTQQMWWTTKAVRSSRFTVTVTKSGSTLATTSYSPGEILDVHVKQTVRDPTGVTYRGVMMHWQSSSNSNSAGMFGDPNGVQNDFMTAQNVGEWVDIPEAPVLFHSSLNKICGRAVVLHATAGYKQSHVIFRYQTPAVGTGPIALRALIKEGDANRGDFFWPNQAGDIVLTEASRFIPQAVNWFRGALGESCDVVCARASMGCSVSRFAELNTEAKMMSIIDANNVMQCDLPILTGCGELGPTTDVNDHCYVYDSAQCISPRDTALPTCSASATSPLNGRRLCPCDIIDTSSTSSGSTSTGSGTCTPLTTCPNASEPLCGDYPDGCGGVVFCGTAEQVCSGTRDVCDALTNKCVCQPTTCQELGYVCEGASATSNGCGGFLNCGSCVSGFSCLEHQCVPDGCTPLDSCSSLDHKCGPMSTTCIENTTVVVNFNCGECQGTQQTCDVTGSANHSCTCTPKPAVQACTDESKVCGQALDGCGNTVTCGNVCGPNESCVPQSGCKVLQCGINEVLQSGACKCAKGFEIGATGFCENTADPLVDDGMIHHASALLILLLVIVGLLA